MGASQREKGKRGERMAAELLRNAGFPNARRGVQFQGGPGSPDVVGIPGVHLEVKFGKQVPLWPYKVLEQAESDALDDDAHAALCKRDYEPWLWIVPHEHIKTFCKSFLRGEDSQPETSPCFENTSP